jgi:hypothetical protein
LKRTFMAKQTVPPLPLPPRWPRHVRSAAVHAIALLGWYANPSAPVRGRHGQQVELVVTHADTFLLDIARLPMQSVINSRLGALYT